MLEFLGTIFESQFRDRRKRNGVSTSENFELQSIELSLPLQRLSMSEANGGEINLSHKISLTSICYTHKQANNTVKIRWSPDIKAAN